MRGILWVLIATVVPGFICLGFLAFFAAGIGRIRPSIRLAWMVLYCVLSMAAVYKLYATLRP